MLLTLGFILSANAQKSNSKEIPDNDTTIFKWDECDMPAQSPGDINWFYNYIKDSTRYPLAAREESVQGRVLLSFIIEKGGSISHIKVVKGVRDDIDKEAIRLLDHSLKWKPAMKNGRPVRQSFIVPIRFSLSG